jgi:hypothetical protein
MRFTKQSDYSMFSLTACIGYATFTLSRILNLRNILTKGARNPWAIQENLTSFPPSRFGEGE